MQLTVNRTGGTSGAVSVSYATSNGTAVAGTDYTAASGTLSWAAGDSTAKTISVAVIDEQLTSGSKTFGVTLSAPAGGATLGTPSMATVTITDNDTSSQTIQFGTANYITTETSYLVEIPVTRTGGASGAATVNYAPTNGTAISGVDFNGGSGTLQWANGNSSTQYIQYVIIDRHLTGPPVSFTETLSGVTGGPSLGSPAICTVTIDHQPAGTVSLTQSSVTVNESAGTLVLSAQRVGGTAGPASIAYATGNGTATSGVAYTAEQSILNWADGEGGIKDFIIPILDQGLTSGSQNFPVTAYNATGAGLGELQYELVTILDNDVRPGTLSFASASVSVSESASTVILPVTRSGGASGPATVTYATVDATAKAGTDYTSTSGTLTWADGDAAMKLITVPITDRQLSGGSNSNFIVNLSESTGATLGSTPTSTITILHNDVPAGSLQFSSPVFQVSENAGTAFVSVTRTSGTSGTVTVGYTTSSGTAVSGTAYASASGTLSWSSGDGSPKNISIPILDQNLGGGSQAFSISLSSATGGAALGAPNKATVTIQDDDLPGTLALTSSSDSSVESSAFVPITVSRTGGSLGTVSVDYVTSNGSAIAGTDYTSTNGTLTWAAGDSSLKTVEVPLLDPGQTSGSRSFTLTLSNPDGNALLAAPTQAAITILDNDVPAGSIQFATAAYSASESSGSITLVVNRTGGNVGPVSVAYATTDQTAVAGQGYSAASGILTWSSGDSTPRMIQIAIKDLQLNMGSQSFGVNLSTPTGVPLWARHPTARLRSPILILQAV